MALMRAAGLAVAKAAMEMIRPEGLIVVLAVEEDHSACACRAVEHAEETGRRPIGAAGQYNIEVMQSFYLFSDAGVVWAGNSRPNHTGIRRIYSAGVSLCAP